MLVADNISIVHLVMLIIYWYGVIPSRRNRHTAFDRKPCAEKLLAQLP